MSGPQNENFRCGVVSIIGRPNVGKSTLLNAIVKEKIAIVSLVPQTTRTKIRGIYSEKRGQIIFIDTPGLHKSKDRLGQMMNHASQQTMGDADCLVHLVDTSEPTGLEEEMVVSQLKTAKAPIILGLNKIDLKGKYVDQYIALWEKAKGIPVTEMDFLTLLPMSGKTGFHIEKLLDVIFEKLPVGPALYPMDTVSDVPQQLAIADIVREKLFWIMREELPHSLAVITTDVNKKKKGLLYIRIEILVDHESQKEIVIGTKGEILKKIGTQARKELEGLLNSKVFLELFVKVKKHWRDDDSLLEAMGFEF